MKHFVAEFNEIRLKSCVAAAQGQKAPSVVQTRLQLCAYLLFACILTRVDFVLASPEDGLRPNSCQRLEGNNLSALPDAPTQLLSSVELKATGELPAHCQITGYVMPNIGFRMGLPDTWSGRFIEMGCGGHCGVADAEYFSGSCAAPMRKGYACLISDLGHKGKWLDGLWAYGDLQAKVDWGYRGTHVLALAGKVIAERYYARKPRKSYFMGCSTGGRQGLQEAQRFPWDFDGIVAGAPPIRLPELYIMFAWGYRATHTSDGHLVLATREFKLLHDAAVDMCDKDDGLVDGIISSPQTCRFRPTVLLCKTGQTKRCLNAQQVRAAEMIYTGPATAAGQPLLSGGPLPGSEFDASLDDPSSGNWSQAYVGREGQIGAYSVIAQEGLRYMFFDEDPGAAWKITDFDFDRDYKRLGIMGAIYDSSNPDLRRFRDAGGKLLIYGGTDDNSVLPRMVTDYYDQVVAVVGGREKTQQFVRLFELPGVGHCQGGPGADVVDYLGAIEAWVEGKSPPDRLIAYHLRRSEKGVLTPVSLPPNTADVSFSRPVFPYPAHARYSGSGDPNNERSFEVFDASRGPN